MSTHKASRLRSKKKHARIRTILGSVWSIQMTIHTELPFLTQVTWVSTLPSIRVAATFATGWPTDLAAVIRAKPAQKV